MYCVCLERDNYIRLCGKDPAAVREDFVATWDELVEYCGTDRAFAQEVDVNISRLVYAKAIGNLRIWSPMYRSGRVLYEEERSGELKVGAEGELTMWSTLMLWNENESKTTAPVVDLLFDYNHYSVLKELSTDGGRVQAWRDQQQQQSQQHQQQRQAQLQQQQRQAQEQEQQQAQQQQQQRQAQEQEQQKRQAQEQEQQQAQQQRQAQEQQQPQQQQQQREAQEQQQPPGQLVQQQQAQQQQQQRQAQEQQQPQQQQQQREAQEQQQPRGKKRRGCTLRTLLGSILL